MCEIILNWCQNFKSKCCIVCSGGHVVGWSRTVYLLAILIEVGIMRNVLVKLFCNWASSSGGDIV